jgi:hypothetical protein
MKNRHRWIFFAVVGPALIAYFMTVALTDLTHIQPVQDKMFGLLGAVLAGIVGAVFPGKALLVGNFRWKKGLSVTLDATGGFALFVIVLFWWTSSVSPVPSNRDKGIFQWLRELAPFFEAHPSNDDTNTARQTPALGPDSTNGVRPQAAGNPEPSASHPTNSPTLPNNPLANTPENPKTPESAPPETKPVFQTNAVSNTASNSVPIIISSTNATPKSNQVHKPAPPIGLRGQSL